MKKGTRNIGRVLAVSMKRNGIEKKHVAIQELGMTRPTFDKHLIDGKFNKRDEKMVKEMIKILKQYRESLDKIKNK